MRNVINLIKEAIQNEQVDPASADFIISIIENNIY